MSKTTAKRFAIGTGLAAVGGYVAGILTAPKSGKETRHDIKEAADKGLAEAEKQLKQLHTEMRKFLIQASERAENTKGKAREDLDVLIAKTKQVKEKARELLSAAHEGDADDKDLRKAIAEAEKAVAHLRAFLKS